MKKHQKNSKLSETNVSEFEQEPENHTYTDLDEPNYTLSNYTPQGARQNILSPPLDPLERWAQLSKLGQQQISMNPEALSDDQSPEDGTRTAAETTSAEQTSTSTLSIIPTVHVGTEINLQSSDAEAHIINRIAQPPLTSTQLASAPATSQPKILSVPIGTTVPARVITLKWRILKTSSTPLEADESLPLVATLTCLQRQSLDFSTQQLND